MRPGRVDQRVAPAVGQPDREDRLAAGADLGDPRALDEGDLDPRLADQVDAPCRAPGTVRNGPTSPSRTRTGRRPISEPQSGITKMDVISRIWVQIWFEHFDESHGRILPVPPRPWEPVAGCPAWSSRRVPASSRRGRSRPGRRRLDGPRHDGRPLAGTRSRRSRIADRRRRRAGRHSSRPSSHAEPAVRAPRSRAPWRRSRSSVTTRSVGRAVGAVDQPDVVDHQRG